RCRPLLHKGGSMSNMRGRYVGLGRLLRQLRRGRATLNDRAWTFSPLALPVGRFLGALRERFIVMRQSSIRIAINAARLQSHTQACQSMADEQASEAESLSAQGTQIASLSQQTNDIRSEERRVGKECRSRWSADD